MPASCKFFFLTSSLLCPQTRSSLLQLRNLFFFSIILVSRLEPKDEVVSSAFKPTSLSIDALFSAAWPILIQVFSLFHIFPPLAPSPSWGVGLPFMFSSFPFFTPTSLLTG